jgi:hypothetical protein
MEEPAEPTSAEDPRDGRADDGRQTSSGDEEPTDEPEPEDPGDEPQEPTEPLVPTGESEPNDSMGDAQAVGLADVVLAEWTPAGDEDWYVLSLHAGDVVDVRTHADDGGCDFDSILIVYDEHAEPRPAVTTCQDEGPEALCIDDTDGSSCAEVTIEVQDDGLFYVAEPAEKRAARRSRLCSDSSNKSRTRSTSAGLSRFETAGLIDDHFASCRRPAAGRPLVPEEGVLSDMTAGQSTYRFFLRLARCSFRFLRRDCWPAPRGRGLPGLGATGPVAREAL